MEREPQLRSPLVLRCVEDYLQRQAPAARAVGAAGSATRRADRPAHLPSRPCRRLRTMPSPCLPARPASSSASPAASTPPSPRCCCKEQGWDVQGLFMSNWEEDDDGYCTAAQDFQDARAVARELGIPLHRVELRRRVPRSACSSISCASTRAGRTPEPRRAVQPRDQVRRGLRLRAAARRERISPPATTRASRTRPTGAELLKARDARQGPELFPARGRRRAARPRR